MLIDELIDEGYLYVLTSRLQSDPIERRFSQYRQMSGGRFLVSLLEVQHSEIILACRTLIKENVNFWDEDLKNNYDNQINDELILTLDLNSNEISELKVYACYRCKQYKYLSISTNTFTRWSYCAFTFT